ncbi:hypothetical protein [Streptomyces yaizuensis]|uniref:Uncharacterized protein n=1 Tax=Streptomyces yaizuensis TaxID=2989713 RepID=A0AA86J3Y5_9ACTN|nr:hypothetical protein [Streptomyces sp. YSPA8]BDT39627.1 hypothetical protein SYYSPA8_37545 [Streptomyces sp. YSPA8]
MATDTAPPVPAGPPDPPAAPAAPAAPAPAADTGIMAALMAAVEPARPVTATAGARPDGDDPVAKADADGVVDRSSPGVTSEAFKAPEDLTGAGSDAAGAKHKEGVFKTLIRAGATRWAKGGGTANKRLDLEKARASAHQVKEARTTTVMKSPGLPTRNGSGGAGGGGRNSGGNSGGNSGRSSTGNGSAGTGRGGSGGATGGGGRGSSGSNGSGGSGGGRGTSGNGGGGSSKDTSPKGAKDSGGKGKDGSSGNAGAGGKAGKDGKAGASGSGGGSTSGGSSGGNSGTSKDKADKDKGSKVDLKKGGGSGQGSGGSSGSSGGSGKNGGSGKSGSSGSGGGSGKGGSGSSGGSGKSGSSGKNGGSGHSANGTDDRTPLQRSRETGHGDGSAVRNAVDHVKAYAQGAKDGYQDKKEENGKEHARLDKAHADHKAKQQDPKKDDPKQQGTTVTGPSGQTIVIAPPDEGDDGVSTDVKPLLVKEIDANTLTLGTDGARGTVSRKELRNFKQYERKLEAKENHLIKVADACKSLEAAAEDEAKDCQELADQAKAVEGGEKLAAKLTKLADSAKAQAAEAAELHKRAKRAAEMCKVVLTNIGTRYAPLYKAVVDSDETKPAELRFYNDKGSYAPAA